MKLFDSQGHAVQTGKMIGQGGQAKVFDVIGNGQSKVLAKVWNDNVPDRDELIAKTTEMTRAFPSALDGRVAWPLATLHAHRGKPACGFTMQAFTDTRPMHDLSTAKYRKVQFPDAHWGCLVTAAINLARLFERCHSLNIVISDVSASNVHVNNKGMVRLIDCDSWQFVAGRKSYLCPVLTLEYAAPELLNVDLTKFVRTPHQDNYSLAVLIFQILFNGRLPFLHPSGDLKLAIASQNTLLSQRQDRFYFPGIAPHELPAGLFQLFETAFALSASAHGRPSAGMWVSELRNLRNLLVECPVEQHHVYTASQPQCPWCEVDKKFGKGFVFVSKPRANSSAAPYLPSANQLPTASQTPSISQLRQNLSNHLQAMDLCKLQLDAIKPVSQTVPLKPTGCVGQPLPTGFLAMIVRWTLGSGREAAKRKATLEKCKTEVRSCRDRYTHRLDAMQNALLGSKQAADKHYQDFQRRHQQCTQSAHSLRAIQEFSRWLFLLNRSPPSSLTQELTQLINLAIATQQTLLASLGQLTTLHTQQLQEASALAQAWAEALARQTQAEADVAVLN